MTGNGVETNFISPHMANVFGGGDEMINLAATVITFYSLATLDRLLSSPVPSPTCGARAG